MPITQRNKIGMLEAMLFANAEPVETDRLAEAMRADPAEVLTLLEKLQKRYDETESGLMPVAFRVTDTFLRVFGLGSLADLPPLHDDPQKEEELPVQQTLEELQ